MTTTSNRARHMGAPSRMPIGPCAVTKELVPHPSPGPLSPHAPAGRPCEFSQRSVVAVSLRPQPIRHGPPVRRVCGVDRQHLLGEGGATANAQGNARAAASACRRSCTSISSTASIGTPLRPRRNTLTAFSRTNSAITTPLGMSLANDSARPPAAIVGLRGESMEMRPPRRPRRSRRRGWER